MSASLRASAASTRTRQRAAWQAVLGTGPALIFYGLFALIPLLVAVYLSFTRWNGLSQLQWIGLQNWQALFSDSVTGHAILLSAAIMVLSWILQTPFSMLLGVFMAGKQVYRSVLSV